MYMTLLDPEHMDIHLALDIQKQSSCSSGGCKTWQSRFALWRRRRDEMVSTSVMGVIYIMHPRPAEFSLNNNISRAGKQCTSQYCSTTVILLLC